MLLRQRVLFHYPLVSITLWLSVLFILSSLVVTMELSIRDRLLSDVRQNGYALKHASEDLRSDREIVLAAVKKNGDALQYASDEMRKNGEIVLAAVEQNGYAFNHASEGLKKNPEFVLAAVQKNGNVLAYASDEMKDNGEIVLAAVRQSDNALAYASARMKTEMQRKAKEDLAKVRTNMLIKVFRNKNNPTLPEVAWAEIAAYLNSEYLPYKHLQRILTDPPHQWRTTGGPQKTIKKPRSQARRQPPTGGIPKFIDEDLRRRFQRGW